MCLRSDREKVATAHARHVAPARLRFNNSTNAAVLPEFQSINQSGLLH